MYYIHLNFDNFFLLNKYAPESSSCTEQPKGREWAEIIETKYQEGGAARRKRNSINMKHMSENVIM